MAITRAIAPSVAPAGGVHRGHRNRQAAAVLAAVVLGATGGCLSEADRARPDDIKVGVLLPFTGDLASYGANIERALIMAAEGVNDGGGIGGHRLRFVVRDTHSSSTRAAEAARSLVDVDGVQLIIGPEEPDTPWAVRSFLQSRGVIMVLAGMSTPMISEWPDRGLMLRLSPSIKAMGAALATLLFNDQRKNILALYADDNFSADLLASFYGSYRSVCIAQHMSCGVPLQVSYDNTSHGSFTAGLGMALAQSPDAIVLMGYPRTASLIISAWCASGVPTTWYLSPALKSIELVTNIPRGCLDQMPGVTPTAPADSEDFARLYAARWQGGEPFAASSYYYDAVALIALAASYQQVDADGRLDTTALEATLRSVSRPGAEPVVWNDLAAAVSRAADQTPVSYRGASGMLNLSDSGQAQIDQVSAWHVQDNELVVGAPIEFLIPPPID